jgi:hypothetical protein
MGETDHASHYETASLPRGEFSLFKEDVDRRLTGITTQLEGIWNKLDRPSWVIVWIISALTTAVGILGTMLVR